MAACFFHSQGATRGAPSSQNQSGDERAIDNSHHTKGTAPPADGAPRPGWATFRVDPVDGVAKPFVMEKGRPQGRAHAFPRDRNRKGGYEEGPKSQTENEVRDPQVSKLHPRDTGPCNAETPKGPSREGTPKGGGDSTSEVLGGGKCTEVLASPRL